MTPITESVSVIELRCLQCSRVAAIGRKKDGEPLRVTPAPSVDAESVRRRRCPWCLGNLRIEDTATEEISVRRRFTPDELVVRPRLTRRKAVR
jgi:hypothetical protein